METTQYLASSEYIDWKDENVLAKAKSLAEGLSDDADIAKACFEFVRDQVNHSLDYKQNPITCKASDVLKESTGYCYAKSHLLAALLRANNIPAGLCYQRLTITDVPPFCLHGLNAVYLKQHGWYRIDARGNKPGVAAEFCPPLEKLAFPILTTGEANLADIGAEPLSVVTETLTGWTTYQEILGNLPDIEWG
ncbi:transglutaminase-like domain-containing protein [Marinomonas transparens]|uniref:Transglutaminase family protein n=1 Tax=Marinomonas transparens TaxID=2795388 RepID=A0A934JRX8_9GAMM|nr:transglutaminase family protein [Marinomonas transparens]MBJ7537171.1 transglutaminase family protein [Marinomonas transparens]